MLVLLTVVACSSAHRSGRPSGSASTGSPATTGPASTSAPKTGGPSPTATPSARSPVTRLHPGHDQFTSHGMWWAVDSTVPADAQSLDNVVDYYRGHRQPVAWGRYLTGSFRLHPAELGFLAHHHIALYVLVPDANCSGCGGGDACGNDRTAAQAETDARAALTAASRLHLPAGVALFKDVEEVSACHGELTGTYLDTWYQRVRHSPYRPAFYGNSTTQRYDFPRAYCAAVRRDPALGRDAILAQDEPETAIGAARGAAGPTNAPPFAPRYPHCGPPQAVRIWQYGESLSGDNVTDIDEVRPDTPGLLAPDGSVTSG